MCRQWRRNAQTLSGMGIPAKIVIVDSAEIQGQKFHSSIDARRSLYILCILVKQVPKYIFSWIECNITIGEYMFLHTLTVDSRFS